MKTILTFTFLLFVKLLAAQTISGNVFDTADNSPITGVTVYFDGTTVGVVTDENGYFSISAKSDNVKALVFSFIGYEKVVLDNPLQYDRKLKVMMKADAEVLDEVVITKGTRFTRKQMLKAFRRQFLGNTKAGNTCKIENEDDIYLYYDTPTKTLYAEAKKPIRIKNKRLEYNVNFELAAFQVSYYAVSLEDADVASTFYAGTTFFKDVSKNGSADKKRRVSYRGSTTHFMRSLYKNDLKNEGFALYVDKLPIQTDSCFTFTDSLAYKKITLKDLPVPEVPNLRVSFAAGSGPAKQAKDLKRDFKKTQYIIMYKGVDQSLLMFNEKRFYIGEHGLFSPITAVVFGGYMGELKAGDLLPDDYEYKPAD